MACGRLSWSEPGNLDVSAENQSEGARIRYSGALLKLRRLQNLYVQYVPSSDGNAFGLCIAAGCAAEQEQQPFEALIMSSSLLVLIFLATVVTVVAIVCGGAAGNEIQQNPNRRPGRILSMHEQELIGTLQGRACCESNAGQQNRGVCHLLQQLRIRHGRTGGESNTMKSNSVLHSSTSVCMRCEPINSAG